MQKVYTYSLVLLCLAFNQTFGQATCENIGFENGSLNGWVLTNGSATDINQQTVFQDETAGTFESGHLLTRIGDGNDPKITDEAIPMVAPGSNYSIRIGNVNHGSRFDRIKTSFVVAPDFQLLQYKFAVILQFPNHQPYQQPGFSIRVTNQGGTTLACNFYQVTATASIDGFKNQNDLRYRNWTTGAIDLRNYIGQTITVEVTVNGCTRQRHFGYAYFDAQCIRAEVRQLPYCPAYEPTLTLKAPDGFASYRWSNGATTQSIGVAPKRGEKYWVKVKPFSSLNDQCEFQFDHTVAFDEPEDPTRENATICEGESYSIGDSTYQQAGTYLTRFYRGTDLCDSVVITTLSVTPLARSYQSKTICEGERLVVGSDVLTTSGTHTTRFSRGPALCDSLVITELTVRVVELSLTPDSYIRTGDSLQLVTQVLPASHYTYSWEAPEGLSCPVCPITWARPEASTQYTVTVEDQELKCRASASVQISVGICTIYAPDAFTPNGDGTNDVFYVEGAACVEMIRELVIYSRWGEVLYRVQNFPPSEEEYGWDGLYHGEQVPAAVYAYKIVVAYKNGTVTERMGAVTVLR